MKKLTLLLLTAGFIATSHSVVWAKASTAGISQMSGAADELSKRRKTRIKGGSGCDSAHDVAEHPECR
ncbi:MAG: hypothetical protein WCB71_14845 [Aestuariivirga sp.]